MENKLKKMGLHGKGRRRRRGGWGMSLLAAGILVLGSPPHAMSQVPTLILQGPSIVSVVDSDGQGVNFDLRALGDVYLDLSQMNGRFQDVMLTADLGHIELDLGATDLWPHTGADTQSVADTEIVSVWGDTLILPDATWSGASYSLLAAHDLYVYGGSLDVEALELVASTVIDNGSGGGVGGGVTIDGGQTTLVPLPGGIWLLGAALLSLARWSGRRRIF